MRRVMVVTTILILGLVIPTVNATESRETDCISGSSSWSLQDQECAVFALGSIVPGDVHLIQFQTDNSVDVLIFSQAGLSVYSNDQSYRTSNVWDEKGTLESLNGTAEWRWTAPLNKSQTNWYIVIDNLDHPQDDDQGSNGGYSATGSITIEAASIRSWTLHDMLWSIDTGEGRNIAGPFSFREGTQILIEALEIEGSPDVFFMTNQQKDLYLQDYSNDFRISDTDILSISSSSSRSWLVPAVHADQDLYLMLDNTASPTGGGSGSTPARLGVVLSILPILNAEISSSDDLLQVDVGQIISLSTLTTPNDWNQLDPAGFSWSFPEADCSTLTTGNSVSLCWTTEGQRTVEVTITSTDGRTDSESVDVNVIDSTPPISQILVSGDIERGVGESFTISGQSSDNGEVAKEEWLVDGVIVQTQNQSGTSLTYSFDSPTDIGNRIITLRVYDLYGLTSESNITVQISDTTAPITSPISGTQIVNPGESVTFSISANDPESSNLTYEWDIDGSIDSDSNGVSDDDIDLVGTSISISYDTGGSRFVSCVVSNEAGLTSIETFTVTILNPQVEETSSSISFAMIAIIILIAILILLAIVAFIWQRSTSRRVAEIIAEQEAEKSDEAPPLTVEEQSQMYSSRRSNDFESIAGMSSSEIQRTSTIESSEVLDDLFSEEVEQNIPEEQSESVQIDDVKTSSSSPSTLGIEIPNMSTSSSLEEPINELPTTITTNCSSCDESFEVDLPSGVNSGKTACPHCGSIEFVQR
ncbi:MAG: hypothetical protein CBC45_002275 [Euryarchaeota archaeon TMED85]|nr:MAG: hypothetical protein CMA04_002715 [Euryarchaeota archaeon]RPG75400.1 MAG: hypothetical protein CBC45_002275 [Euryarchaeota archaeon TMED85]|tara:strand:+ start:2887 stop:5160 length:2274 start_codon:yes stop_codon:yes gene_type:complete